MDPRCLTLEYNIIIIIKTFILIHRDGEMSIALFLLSFKKKDARGTLLSLIVSRHHTTFQRGRIYEKNTYTMAPKSQDIKMRRMKKITAVRLYTDTTLRDNNNIISLAHQKVYAETIIRTQPQNKTINAQLHYDHEPRSVERRGLFSFATRPRPDGCFVN